MTLIHNGEIESLAEYTACKEIEDEIKNLDDQLAGTGVAGIFKELGSSAKEKGFKSLLGLKDSVSNKMNDKKDLKSKKIDAEKRLEEAKSRLDIASKDFNEKIITLQSRVNEIDEEFNKDR